MKGEEGRALPLSIWQQINGPRGEAGEGGERGTDRKRKREREGDGQREKELNVSRIGYKKLNRKPKLEGGRQVYGEEAQVAQGLGRNKSTRGEYTLKP